MDMSINSEVVREFRKKANWSQEDLATASGLSLRTIQRVETDGSAALETRRALAAAFGVQPKDLDGTNARYQPGEMMVGTGMLVTWIGVGWFLDVGVAAVLFGVGAIYLFGQLLRVTVKKRPVLWELVALGLACVLASFAPMVGLEIRLGAVILVGVGSLLMFWRNKA